jgi:hypothetical protein
VTPAEADVGMMPFGLGKLTDLLHEGECFPKIAESKCALDAVGVIAQFPIRRLGSARLHPAQVVERRHDKACMSSRREFRSCACLQTDYWGNRGASDQRSISPNTMSSEPMIAETSASICPRLRKSIAWRWANEGARILHL